VQGTPDSSMTLGEVLGGVDAAFNPGQGQVAACYSFDAPRAGYALRRQQRD